LNYPRQMSLVSSVDVLLEPTAAVTRMQILNKKAKGILIVALINGIVGGMSVPLAILAYRHWGWHLFATLPVLMLTLLMALFPVTSKILRASHSASFDSDQSKPTDARR
jgi:hypothetical protein